MHNYNCMLNKKTGEIHNSQENAVFLRYKATKDLSISPQHNNSLDLSSLLENKTQNLGFQLAKPKHKQVKHELLTKSRKGSRDLTPTVHHRFIALMLSCGKKSVSYNVFINALSKCKDLVDLAIKHKDKVILKIPDNTACNNSQNLRNSVSKIHVEKSKTSVAVPRNSFGMDRGMAKRLKNNLLIFDRDPQHTRGTFISKMQVEGESDNRVNVPVSIDTCSHVATEASPRRFRVNTRLLNRRSGLIGTTNLPIKKDTPFDLQLARQIPAPSFVCATPASNSSSDRVVGKTLVTPQSKPENKFAKSTCYTISKPLLTDKPESTRIGIEAVNKVLPSVETRKVRIGGARYAVPSVPHKNRQEGIGIRWLIACAFNKTKRSKDPFSLCLAHELADSFKNQGESIRKRESSHQLAAANRAYTRYRWW